MSSKYRYTIEFHSYWHCGSGLGAGAKADALVVRDADGLPFVPGRTVKGLVREALSDYLFLKYANSQEFRDKSDLFFETLGMAKDKDSDETYRGTAFFSDAKLPDFEASQIIEHKAADLLIRQMASTKIDDDGVAADHTLRSIEVVVPCKVEGYISGLPNDLLSDLEFAMKLIRRMGLGRNRGLGRCTFTFDPKPDFELISTALVGGDIPDSVQMRCTLTTDVILNQKSASEGANTTLDFIPGANFLGIAADSLYMNGPTVSPSAYALFHSGKVRFGDAHPLYEEDGLSVRALRTPASMFYPKGQKVSDACYVHHFYRRDRDKADGGNPQQLKQCRTGFYAFHSGAAHEVRTRRTYAIKSAYDPEARHSKDSAMFGYESLRAGLTLGFTVSFDPDVAQDLRRSVVKSLIGNKRVGRSRSAQYGQVSIERGSFAESLSHPDSVVTLHKDGKDVKAVVIYADSRLVFLDSTATPTLQPTPDMLGLPSASHILWDKSQVRPFQYSPWNYKRNCPDSDRYGIEKGSVFVVQVPDGAEVNVPSVVGSFRAEGFGCVIVNPDFLEAVSDENGRAKTQFVAPLCESTPLAVCESKPWKAEGSPLIEFIARHDEQSSSNRKIYAAVNDFVSCCKHLFAGKEFASQWGTIRTIANTHADKKDLLTALWTDEQNGYLVHGIAKEKWRERGRLRELQNFMEQWGGRDASLALVNLASEMAKICRQTND